MSSSHAPEITVFGVALSRVRSCSVESTHCAMCCFSLNYIYRRRRSQYANWPLA